MRTVESIVAFCCRWPWLVITASLFLAVSAGWYTSQNFAINTDSEQLIDAKVGWRMRQARFDAAFPQKTNLTAVVIDGKTPELAESAAARLTEKLQANPKLFSNVRRPDGGAFFNQNGLLFLSLDEVRDTTQQLIKAQPFLGGLASDPSLRGIMTNLNPVLLGVGAGEAKLSDIQTPMQRFAETMTAHQGYEPQTPRAAQFFGGAGRDYMAQYGTKPETFGRISVKARQHAARNPLAVFRQVLSLEEVMASPKVFDPLTRYQCCPPTCGAAAAIVCSADFARKHGLDMSVVIAAQAMTTDTPASFESSDMRKLVGYDMTVDAVKWVYERAAIGPEDVDVVELHDCFTANELISYEALGLTAPGTAEKFVLDGDNTYGGRYVVNPSGGLLSKGHPLGATGLAQCAELVWQLRGQAEQRQVEGARVALQHNLGLGGACVVTLYQRA